MYDDTPLREAGFEPGSKFDASPSAGFGSRGEIGSNQFSDGSQEGFERGRPINLHDRNHQTGGYEPYRSGSRSMERPYGYERQDYGYGNQGKYQNEPFGPYGYGNDDSRYKASYGSEDGRSHYGYSRGGYGDYNRSYGYGTGYDNSTSMYGYGRGAEESSPYGYRGYGRSDSYNPYRYGDYGYGDVRDRSFYGGGRYTDRGYSGYGGYGRDQSPYRHERYGYGGYGRDQSPHRFERYGYDGYGRDKSPYIYGRYGYGGYGRGHSTSRLERYGYGGYGRDQSLYRYGRDQIPYSYGMYGYGGYGRNRSPHTYEGQGYGLDSYGRYGRSYGSRMTYGPPTYGSGRYGYNGAQPFSVYRPNYHTNYPYQNRYRYPYDSSPYRQSLYNYRQGSGGYKLHYLGRYVSSPYARHLLVGNRFGYGYRGHPGYQADRSRYGRRYHGYGGDYDRRRIGMGPYLRRSTYGPPYGTGYRLGYPLRFPSQYGY